MRPQRAAIYSGRNGEGGQSLVAALIVLIVITAVAGSITVGLMIEAGYATHEGKRVAASYLARSGIEAGVNQLLSDETACDGVADGWYDNAEVLGPNSLGAGTYEVVCRDAADGRTRFGVVDEESKLNINSAGPAEILSLDPAFTKDIVSAIVAHRKERPFTSVDELTLLPDVDRTFLSAPRESAPAGLRSLITVFGDGKINVNTAPLPVLACLDGLDAARARQVVELRQGKGDDGSPRVLKSVGEVGKFLGMSDKDFAPLRSRLSVSSSHFTITAVGRLAEETIVVRELRQVVKRDRDGLLILRLEELR